MGHLSSARALYTLVCFGHVQYRTAAPSKCRSFTNDCIANQFFKEFAQLANADLLVAAQLLSAGTTRGSAWSKAMNEAPVMVRKFVGAYQAVLANAREAPCTMPTPEHGSCITARLGTIHCFSNLES